MATIKLKPFKKRLSDGAWIGVPMDVYHAHPALSSSRVRELLLSPLQYKRALDGVTAREATNAQDFGTCFHAALLEERNCFHIHPEELAGSKWNANRSDCKAWIEQHSDKAILSPNEVVDLLQASNYARSHPKVVANKLLDGGTPEASWIIQGEKARTDYVKLDGTSASVVDVKTTTDASDASFRREIVKWGYHIQAAWYRRVLRGFGLNLAAWYFLIVQKGALPLVNVLELPKSAMDLGDKEIEKALLLLQQCKTNNTWPDFVGDMNEPADKIQLVDLPAWAYCDADLEGAEEIIP